MNQREFVLKKLTTTNWLQNTFGKLVSSGSTRLPNEWALNTYMVSTKKINNNINTVTSPPRKTSWSSVKIKTMLGCFPASPPLSPSQRTRKEKAITKKMLQCMAASTPLLSRVCHEHLSCLKGPRSQTLWPHTSQRPWFQVTVEKSPQIQPLITVMGGWFFTTSIDFSFLRGPSGILYPFIFVRPSGPWYPVGVWAVIRWGLVTSGILCTWHTMNATRPK